MFDQIEAAAKTCRQCANVHDYERVVVAEGSLDAPVLIVGQDPGAREIEEGRPFCGPSGQLLRESLDTVGITSEYRLITNVNLHRSKNNSGFSLTERRRCWDSFTEKILKASKAKLIVPVGGKATEIVFELFKHGMERPVKMQDVAGQVSTTVLFGRIVDVVPCIHPAFVLRGGGRFSERHMDLIEQLMPVASSLQAKLKESLC